MAIDFPSSPTIGQSYIFNDVTYIFDGDRWVQQETTVLFNNVEDQTLSGGGNVVAKQLTAGDITIDCGDRPLQYVANIGAFTITAPTEDGSCMLLIENESGCGSIAFSGFSVGVSTGDDLTATFGDKFTVSIWRIDGISGYRVAAHQ